MLSSIGINNINNLNAEANPQKVIEHLRRFTSSFKNYIRFIGILVVAFVVKILFSATTFSSDFRNLAHMASFTHTNIVFAGPYTFSRYLMNMFYRFWIWLPVEHVNPSQAFNLIVENPTIGSVGYILALKAPMILFDFLTGIVLYKCILKLRSNRKDATLGMTLWLFNPYLTLSIEMDGTIDIVSAFFLILAVYLFLKEKWELAGLSLAVGAIARFYPLTAMPFFLIIADSQHRKTASLRILAGFIGGLMVAVLPFIVKFRNQFIDMLINLSISGNKEFTWFFGHTFTVNTPPETNLSVVAIIYTLLIIMLKKKWRNSNRALLDAIIILLIAYLAFSHWNRYYSIWVTPLVTLDYVVNRKEAGFKTYSLIFILLFLGWFMFGARWHITNFFWVQYIPKVFIPLRHIVVESWKWIYAGYLTETFSRSVLAATSIVYITHISLRNTFGHGFKVA